jgi:Lrp/AsnC family transcriptional regulator, leucine-responsive regulatory protein
MTFDSEKLLDGIGWKLLMLLQEDARRSYSELGRVVGLSAPAVAERVRRMEEAGIIVGYHTTVDAARVGLPLIAFMRLSEAGAHGSGLVAAIAAIPEVLECHRVTGGDSYVLKVIARSVGHLETIIDCLTPHAHVTTSLVLSSPIARRPVSRPSE